MITDYRRYKQYPDKRGIVQKKCECKTGFRIRISFEESGMETRR